jgi:hypothetical protein
VLLLYSVLYSFEEDIKSVTYISYSFSVLISVSNETLISITYSCIIYEQFLLGANLSIIKSEYECNVSSLAYKEWVHGSHNY